MNEFREWLSDNLRYIILGFAIIVILILLFVGFRMLASIIDATQGNKDYVNNVQQNNQDMDENNPDEGEFTEKPDDEDSENNGTGEGNEGTGNNGTGEGNEGTGEGSEGTGNNGTGEGNEGTENNGTGEGNEGTGNNGTGEGNEGTENNGTGEGNEGTENNGTGEGSEGTENNGTGEGNEGTENNGTGEGNEGTGNNGTGNNGTGNNGTSQDNSLKKNQYPKVNSLIFNYYDALSRRDVNALRGMLDSLSTEDEQAILNSDYIESYSGIVVYTKSGLADGSYVVFACYDHKYKGYATILPGMSYLYVETASDGSLYILSTLSDAQMAHVTAVLDDADTQKLLKDTQKLYDETLQKDAALKSYLSSLGVIE